MVPLVLKLQHSDMQSSQWLHPKVHVVCINQPRDVQRLRVTIVSLKELTTEYTKVHVFKLYND